MIPYSYIINTSKSYIFIGLFCWNIIVFFLYGIDKYKAVKSSWRISEKRLLTYAYLGGGVGASLGGRFFRHKTTKDYFRVAWTLGVIENLVILYWLFN